jgi:IclR family transcriptional regulator, acetate operon repressor
VLLAFGPAARRQQYLARPLTVITPNTICAPDQLEIELATVTRDGHGLDREEFIPGVCCVSAPFRDSDAVSAAIAVTVPADRFRERSAELIAAVVAASSMASN